MCGKIVNRLCRTGLIEHIKNTEKCDPRVFLTELKRSPGVEQLAKVGLHRLINDCIYNYHYDCDYRFSGGEPAKALHIDKYRMKRLVKSNGGGWEHVSISPFKRSYTPTWDEMCKLKDMFFCSDETVVQYHPAKNEYVNNLPNCLHLWRPINEKMPAPPSIFVGVKHGQSIEEVKAAIKEYDHLARSKDEKI